MSAPDPARPSISQARKAIADRMVRAAIADYRNAERERAEAVEAVGDNHTLDPLMRVAEDRASDAGENLVRAILATGGDPGLSHGVRCDGRLYLVGPDRESDDAMKLTVVAEGAVVDVAGMDLPTVDAPGAEAAPAAAEDLEEEEDDSMEVIDTRPGRPGRPVTRVHSHERKMPLLRATHTLCAPWDRFPFTLEMIVLADSGLGDLSGDDQTAAKADLPELREAGWESTDIGPLTLYTRVVV